MTLPYDDDILREAERLLRGKEQTLDLRMVVLWEGLCLFPLPVPEDLNHQFAGYCC